mmetsp:Transcript_7846/g.12080  ORF Transcript_7846/g.12080 Transcript_7846/m.12080 type:complete len:213 (+) Transcript_7846:106-744(+)
MLFNLLHHRCTHLARSSLVLILAHPVVVQHTAAAQTVRSFAVLVTALLHVSPQLHHLGTKLRWTLRTSFTTTSMPEQQQALLLLFDQFLFLCRGSRAVVTRYPRSTQLLLSLHSTCFRLIIQTTIIHPQATEHIHVFRLACLCQKPCLMSLELLLLVSQLALLLLQQQLLQSIHLYVISAHLSKILIELLIDTTGIKGLLHHSLQAICSSGV